MADITPGYTFVSGEKNVDHADLNALGAGTINTTFHTGKSSVSANPTPASTELMVYDSSALSFKKGTLAALVMDHTGLLSARSAKTVPVAADALLLSDSAASGAYKQITLANLLFGAAAHTAPVAGDLFAVYDITGTAVRRISLGNLITLAVAHTAPVTADELLVRENGGAVRKMTLGNLINGATALTVPAAGQFITIYDGAYKKVDLAVLISGIATALTSPAGTELLQVNDGGTLKKITTANLKAYARVGLAGSSYVRVVEQQAPNTGGGTFTAGAWRVRSLNTELVDTGSIASVASSQVTLPAGTYRFAAYGYARDCAEHRCKLYNATAAADINIGSCARSAGNNSNASFVHGRFTLAVSSAIELQHYCNTTGTFGTAMNDGSVEIYAQVEFWKEEA